jgi:transposase InsO family protein
MAVDELTGDRWARFRHAVIGPLLVSPPAHGRLRAELRELSRKVFEHPVTGAPMRVGFSTLEKWYYAARSGHDPYGQLRRRVRKDAGTQRAVCEALLQAMKGLHASHPTWSYALHYKNLDALVEADPELAPMPSYATVRRTMKAHGLYRHRRRTDHKAERGARETRSFEKPHAHALWHLDFHHGKRHVLCKDGRLVKPKLMAVLDDHTRLCCHAQWYLEETGEALVHGLSQAIQKRGRPQQLLTDNGSAMKDGELREGLARLGILHEHTLPACPEQNGKQEAWWNSVEGRPLAMLERVERLTLDALNHATQAWVEMEYNRARHSEIGEAPAERFLRGPDVGRPSPTAEELRLAFRVEETRVQRRSDGTLSIAGVRYEVPSRYRTLERLSVRFASWDLSMVHLVDDKSGALLAPLYPLDRTRNGTQSRRVLAEAASASPTTMVATTSPSSLPEMAPLLRQLITTYDRAGLPPAYVPKDKP